MKLFKIKGIQIELDISTLIIILMVGYSIGQFFVQLLENNNIITGISDIPIQMWIYIVILGLSGGVMMLISILIHELTHSLIAQKYGMEIKRIRLYVFGGVSEMGNESETPRREFWMAIGGPLSSLVLGGLFLLPYFLIPFNTLTSLYFAAFLFYSGYTNISLGIFNLIPAYPTDGGRVLRSIIWKIRGDLPSSTKTAAKVGNIFAYLIIGLGFAGIFFFSLFSGIWLILVGIFLRNSVRQAMKLADVQESLTVIFAGNLCTTFDVIIPPDTAVDEIYRNYFNRYKKGYFPVGFDQAILGILHYENIRNIPLDRQNATTAKDLMTPIDAYPHVSETDNGYEVFKKLAYSDKTPDIVMVKDENNQYCGYIGKDEISFQMNYKFQEIPGT